MTGDGASTRAYDGAGNRTDGSITVGAGNRISGDGMWTYTYNAAGQRTKKSLGASAETWTYEYDHRGHLTRLDQRSTDGGTLVSRTDFYYDALDNLIRRVMLDGSLAVLSDARYVADAWNPAKAGGVGIEGTDSLLDLDGSNAATGRRVFGDPSEGKDIDAACVPEGPPIARRRGRGRCPRRGAPCPRSRTPVACRPD